MINVTFVAVSQLSYNQHYITFRTFIADVTTVLAAMLMPALEIFLMAVIPVSPAYSTTYNKIIGPE